MVLTKAGRGGNILKRRGAGKRMTFRHLDLDTLDSLNDSEIKAALQGTLELTLKIPYK